MNCSSPVNSDWQKELVFDRQVDVYVAGVLAVDFTSVWCCVRPICVLNSHVSNVGSVQLYTQYTYLCA